MHVFLTVLAFLGFLTLRRWARAQGPEIEVCPPELLPPNVVRFPLRRAVTGPVHAEDAAADEGRNVLPFPSSLGAREGR